MPKADVFAGKGSFAAKLKARREAIEAGKVEEATEAFRKGEWKDASVDGTVNNQKVTIPGEDVDGKQDLRGGTPGQRAEDEMDKRPRR